MAFVPGKKHDLFLSYAHEEAAWVDVFHAALSKEFQERTGKKVTIWQDSQNLRLGQNWRDEIEEGIRQAAAFLAVISPIYHNSDWCKRERELLLKHHGGLERLKVASFYRLLKIIKTPGPGKAHETLLKDLQHVKFFDTGDGYELASDSKQFTAMIRKSERAIRELLTIMRNQMQALYVAPVPWDMADDRRDLQNQLADYGYNVGPEVLLSPEHETDELRGEMEKSTMAIFLLGGRYDQFIEKQIEVAQEFGKQMIFWIHPGKSKGAEDNQNALISRVSEHKDFPAGSQVLGGPSIRSMLDDLRGVLDASQEEPAASASTEGTKVYLLYDNTMPDEAQGVKHLSELLKERKLEFLHFLHRGPDGEHEQLMRTSNAVLLFRSVTPEPDLWLSQNVFHLAYSQPMFQKEPDFKAKAALVSKPQLIPQLIREGGIQVFGYDEPFSPHILDPFFDKLATAGGAYAGG